MGSGQVVGHMQTEVRWWVICKQKSGGGLYASRSQVVGHMQAEVRWWVIGKQKSGGGSYTNRSQVVCHIQTEVNNDGTMEQLDGTMPYCLCSNNNCCFCYINAFCVSDLHVPKFVL